MITNPKPYPMKNYALILVLSFFLTFSYAQQNKKNCKTDSKTLNEFVQHKPSGFVREIGQRGVKSPFDLS